MRMTKALAKSEIVFIPNHFIDIPESPGFDDYNTFFHEPRRDPEEKQSIICGKMTDWHLLDLVERH